MRLVVRRALPTDADRLGAVHAQSLQETYLHLLSAGNLASVSAEERAVRWRRMIAQPTEYEQLVVEIDDELVGSCLSG